MSPREIQITVDHFLGAFKEANPFAKNKVTELGDERAVDETRLREQGSQALLRARRSSAPEQRRSS